VDLAQRGVLAVEGVLRAIVLERRRRERDPGRVARAADRVLAHGRAAGERVVGLGVDVVAEADDEVEVLVGHRLVRVVEAVREVLAREERELELLPRVGRWRGAEAPDRALAAARLEAVVVLLVRPEARDARLDAPARSRAGRDRLARHDVAEPAVARNLEPDAAAALRLGDARPQRDRARRRVAGGHAFGEPARRQHPPPLRTRGRGQRRRREDHGPGGGRAGQELAA
jgi:hypothetical protein